MAKNKSEGAKMSKLSSEKFAQFPDWSRELMENADESDKPMLREHIEGYANAEGVKVKPTAPTSEEESGVMAERLYYASRTTANPGGMRFKTQAEVNDWKVLAVQTRLFDGRELAAAKLVAGALEGDLLKAFERKRKLKVSVYDCFVAIGEKVKNRVQLMLDERTEEFAQGKIYGRKMIGMAKDERPTNYIGELEGLKGDCADLAKWVGLEQEHENAMSDGIMVRHLLAAWHRNGVYTLEIQVAVREFEKLKKTEQSPIRPRYCSSSG